MKIIRLTAENVKKLKVVDITPATGLNQITGKNGSGKTSVLDSIWWALGGKEGIQKVPIRKGAEEATIRLDLGTIIVKRTFTASGTSVIVLNPLGAEPGTPDKKLPTWGSPQDMLDALMGELSFDPLAFARMDGRAQRDELRKISKLDVDIDQLDMLNAGDFKTRTDLNRDAKKKRAQADGLAVPSNLPKLPVDESELLNQIQGAGEHNAAIETRKARREQAERDVADKQAESVRLKMQATACRESAEIRVADLQQQILDVRRRANETASQLELDAVTSANTAIQIENKLASADPLPEPIQVAEIRANLDAAKKTNAGAALREQRDRINAEAASLEAEAKQLTDRMAGRQKEKADAIASAKMPIDGLGFGDGAITFNGVPFDQASDAEQLRVSCSIAMAANTKLRVIRIKDGSLLDEDGVALIRELAAEKDYQVWMECVDKSGKVGIFMEDGEVAVNNQAAELVEA